MGRLRPKPVTGESPSTIALPQVDRHGGMPLMEALAARRSSREFSPDPLPLPLLAGLLWAAFGVNRPEGGRTAPTAINPQEIEVFAALPTGAYLYEAAEHALMLVSATDVAAGNPLSGFRGRGPARPRLCGGSHAHATGISWSSARITSSQSATLMSVGAMTSCISIRLASQFASTAASQRVVRQGASQGTACHPMATVRYSLVVVAARLRIVSGDGPLLVAAVLFALSLVSPVFLPGIVTADNRVPLLLVGLAWGLIGGALLEELGWTEFAVPRLRLWYGALATGLFVGLLWGAWHFLIAFWASSVLAGEQSLAIFVAGFLAFYVVALPAYRVLMVWVYDRTASLLVAMLMHAFLSASTLILQPQTTAGHITWNFVLAATLWPSLQWSPSPTAVCPATRLMSALQRAARTRHERGRTLDWRR